MPLITFKPSGKTIEVPNGSLLLDATKAAGISVEAPCGGHGICGKCLVRIQSGKVDFNNNGLVSEDLIKEGFVLICKTKVQGEPICVEVISQLDKEQGKFSKLSEDIRLIDNSLLPNANDFEALVKRIPLTVLPPEVGDGLSDYDRFKNAVLMELKGQDIEVPLNILKGMPDTLRYNDGKITLTYFEKNSIIYIVDIGTDSLTVNYGIAIDIGTTTIAVQLISMSDGTILASKTDYNAQIECGLDVISRINYAKKPEKLIELKSKVLFTINNIINELASENGINKKCIYNASIAGNTTMVHLLLGIVPEYIRLEPYTPAVYSVPYYRAEELGLDINHNTFVYIAPSVGSYVGGDITSGLLCTELSTDSEDVCLFIDIGTNGELVLGNSDFLLGCACSAGPAFEGSGIENGMRASNGAIETVEVDKETGFAKCTTIGQALPIGICGSGIISLISELFSTGWIDAAGKLDRTRKSAFIEAQGKNGKYIIVPASESGNGKEIFITEADIDNFIRAKAAIFSACHIMLEKISMNFDSLSKIYIAGGFGRFLNIKNSKIIGLIPNLDEDRIKFIGNSSIIGAYMTLVSKKHRDKQVQIARRITYIDLSNEPDYMSQYTAALFLPHTDLRLFE